MFLYTLAAVKVRMYILIDKSNTNMELGDKFTV